MIKRYYVVSPAYEVTIPGLDYGEGPTESVSDVVEVEAKSKREAIRIAMKSPEFKNWLRDARYGGYNPFTGVKAYEVNEEEE